MALDFPSNPADGEVFGSYVWSSSKGVWQSREESATVAITSPTAPTSANNGDLWYNTERGITYIYYDDGSSAQWVEVVTSGTPELSTKANLSGGNTFDGTQTFNTPIAISSGGTGANSLSTAQANLQIPLSPNYIINGAFDINQRNFTSTTTSAAYGLDRWQYTYGTGTCTYSVQALPTGLIPVNSNNFARVVVSGQSAANASCYIRQQIEDVKTLEGKTATVSFWAKAASGNPFIAVEMIQVFGTGGTPSPLVLGSTSVGNINKVQLTGGSSWTRYSMTVSIPSIAGKTIGTDINSSTLILTMWLSAGSDFSDRASSIGIQNNTFDIAGVQLEEGIIATPFRRNQPNIQAELAACQRYFQRWTQPPLRGVVGSSTTAARMGMVLPVAMRIGPVASISGSLLVWNGSSTGTITGIATSYTDQFSVEFDLNMTSSHTAGQALSMYQSGSAYMDLNSEL